MDGIRRYGTFQDDFLNFISHCTLGKIYNTHRVYYKNITIGCGVCYDLNVTGVGECMLKIVKNSVLRIIVVNVTTFCG